MAVNAADILGRVRYIEPTNVYVRGSGNDVQRTIIPSNNLVLNDLEDYCIAVDLEVYIPDRASCGLSTETGEMYIIQYSSNKGNISFMHGTDGHLTTNFTDVDVLRPNDSTAEMFGIESISISYDSWLYPEVTIRFVDVRGASVMQPEEYAYQNKEGQGSLYRALFSFPPPMFRLKVKGFYGKGATYYLCMSDSSIELDASSGNFIITAKFIGMMYRIYADIPMSYICIAPYMKNGLDYWDAKVADGTFAFLNRDGTMSSMVKFPDLMRNLADVSFDMQKTSAAAEGEKITADLDNQLLRLDGIKTSCPMNKWIMINGNEAGIFLVGDETKESIANDVKAFKQSVKDYDEAYGTTWTKNFEPVFSFEDKKNILELNYVWGKDGIHHLKDDKDNIRVHDTYITTGAAETFISNQLAGNKENNITFFIFPGQFSDAMSVINNKIDESRSALLSQRAENIQKYQEMTNILIEQALGFTPSIQNIYSLAFAHMDTFMHVFYEHMSEIKNKIDTKNPDRAIESFDCKKDVTKDATFLPPYPAFFAQKYSSRGPNDPKSEIWPEEIPGGKGSVLDEVNFVKDLLSAAKLYQEKHDEAREYFEEAKKNFENGVGTDFTNRAPSTSVDDFIPMTTYDYVNKDKMQNPYNYLKTNEYSADAFERNVFATFALRALYYLSTNGYSDAENFGTFEAVNMAKAIGEDIADDKFWTFIEDLKNKSGVNAVNILKNEVSKYELEKIGNLLNGDVSTELGDYFPIGRPNLLDIQKNHSVSKTENPNYILEQEGEEAPKNKTFIFYESRDYIQTIYNKIDALIDGTSEEDDKKYNIKARKDTVKQYRDNIDYEFNNDDVSTMRGIVYTMEGKKTTLEKIANNNYNDLMDNHYVKYPSIIDESKSKSLFDSEIYKMQTDKAAKAYLFLSAMPIKSSHKDGNQVCGIPAKSKNGVELKSVLLREGSFYWREDIMKNGADPINLNGKFKPAKANETYIGESSALSEFFKEIGHALGVATVETVNPLPVNSGRAYLTWNAPLGCTASRREVLKEMFLKFADEYVQVEGFLTNAENYENKSFEKGISSEAIQKDGRAKKFLNNTFFWVGTVLDYYAGRSPEQKKFKTGEATLVNAFNAFISSLKRIYVKEMKEGQETALQNAAIKRAEDPFNNNDLRLSTYLTIKNLYDKWLCCPFNGRDTWSFNATKPNPKSDFSKFVYIDSFYKEIGKNLLVNVSKVYSWISECLPTQNVESSEGSMKYTGKSFYEYLTEIAQSVGGMLMALPIKIGGISDNDMADMFRAMPFNSDWDTDTSSFVFIYTYKPSEHIGVDQYEDDGFQINTEQVTELLGGEGLSIPAFGVSYGKQNQSFFKNITLNTESNNVTEASIGATLAIASKGSETARETTLFGQDLYRVKTSYSYQCEFDMMGCVQVMPLMYFQLNNVPFWRGAYMVIKVSHQITAGDMTTHVVGVRINRNALPMSDGTLIPSKETGVAGATGSAGGGGTYGSGSGGGGGAGSAGSWNDAVGNVNMTLPDKIDYEEGNILEDKPVICLTPAHGPHTSKSAEWYWSSLLIDEYIIPKLKKLKFYDGTSYASNIQRCNKGGKHTGAGGYSTEETRNTVKKWGSKKVISVVPHWNGDGGQYYAVFPGYIDPSTGAKMMREDSSLFGDMVVEEATKAKNKFEAGEFKKIPDGAMIYAPNPKLSVQKHYLGAKNTDGGPKQNCACVLTENWFVNYPKGCKWTGNKDLLEKNKSTWGAKDENGKYKMMEGWLFDEEGLNAVADVHVEAIRRYIEHLHEVYKTPVTPALLRRPEDGGGIPDNAKPTNYSFTGGTTWGGMWTPPGQST